MNYPLSVKQTQHFLNKQDIWFILSENSPATSCRDAATRRQRLGKTGIPLRDELRSHAIVYQATDGEEKYAILHCRAHRHFNEEKVCRILNISHFERLPADKLKALTGMQYGTVNPFFYNENIVHLFDKNVQMASFSPHTMMTNAGDFKWAIEFDPHELLTKMPNIKIVDITNNDLTRVVESLPVFGILTGNGPDTGMSLWRTLNHQVHQTLIYEKKMQGDLSYPNVFVQSLADMGLSMELTERHIKVWQLIEKAINRFCDDGVTHIAIACNITTYFTEDIRALCEPRGVEFISIAEVAFNYIQERQLTDLTLLGIPIVSQMGIYSAYRDLSNQGVVAVDAHMLDEIKALGYMIKQANGRSQDHKALNKLRHILRSGVKTKRVLIALTEISILLARFPQVIKAGKIGDIEVIDSLNLYGKALAQIYLKCFLRE